MHCTAHVAYRIYWPIVAVCHVVNRNYTCRTQL